VAKGKDPKGGDVEDESADPDPLAPGDPGYDEDCADCTVTELPQSPSMELLKSSAYDDTDEDTKVNVGDHINYTFTLENTGNVTIDDVSLEDPLFAAPNPVVTPELVLGGDANSNGKLDVGETWTYTAAYAITQTDLDAGGVWNLAVAKGKDPKGGDVEDESADPDPLAPGDPGYDEDCADCTVTELPQSPSMELLKSSAYDDTDEDTKVNVGDHINYTFT